MNAELSIASREAQEFEKTISRVEHELAYACRELSTNGSINHTNDWHQMEIAFRVISNKTAFLHERIKNLRCLEAAVVKAKAESSRAQMVGA